jgi:putative endonuclease
MNKKEIGRWGEEIAADYLCRKGYSVIDRNFTTPEGEIDIIAIKVHQCEERLIFAEVKTRTSAIYGYPEEAITLKKWKNMLKAIDIYLQNHLDYQDDWQIDVIAIQRLKKDQPPEIEHFENVIMDYDRD